MFDQIPLQVLEQYEGCWIVWDQDAKMVVGSGATLDEAEDQAEQVKTNHLLRVHHVLPRDAEISGML
jgi:predicted RNase H-like HicB family nuclease